MKIRRWIFAALWVLSLAAVSSFGGAVSYGLFFAMTLLPVVSLLYIACVSVRFKIYQELGNRSMVCGQPEPYFFVLQNEDHFTFASVSVSFFSDFSRIEGLPENAEHMLLPGDRFAYETKLICRYRGEYEVGIKETAVTDFFRLFRIKYPASGRIKALVLPQTVRLSALQAIQDVPALPQRENTAGMEPDSVVRDYAEGDSLNRIHWKATARQGKLMVRVRRGEEKRGISVLCETKRYGRKPEEYLPLENKMLEALLALVFFFAEKNTGISILYGQKGLTVQQIRGIEDYETFYRQTAGLVFDGDEDFLQTLETAVAQGALADSRLVFCVLHALNAGIMAAAERLEAAGSLVVIYVISDQEQEFYVRQSRQRRKIIAVSVEDELEGRM